MMMEDERRGLNPATVASLKTMISKWENGKLTASDCNPHLLAAALSIAVADLGLAVDPDFRILVGVSAEDAGSIGHYSSRATSAAGAVSESRPHPEGRSGLAGVLRRLRRLTPSGSLRARATGGGVLIDHRGLSRVMTHSLHEFPRAGRSAPRTYCRYVGESCRIFLHHRSPVHKLVEVAPPHRVAARPGEDQRVRSSPVNAAR
jgi:hypothetical protein